MKNKNLFLSEIRKHSKEALSTEQEAMFSALFDSFSAVITEEDTERKAKQVAEINNILGFSETPEKNIAEQIRGLVAKMDEIDQRSNKKLNDKEKMLLRKKLQEAFDKKEIKQAFAERKALQFDFNHVRSAAIMTTANVMSGTQAPAVENYFVDEEIAMLRYPENFIIDIISSMQVSVVPANVVEKEQDTLEGNAALTAEGVLKPLVSFTFKNVTYSRKKYAGHIEYTEELELDFSRLFQKIISLFEDEVLRSWQNGVLADIIANYSSTYVSSALDGEVAFANEVDAINAIALQIRDVEFEPNVVWINPGVLAKLLSTKDDAGNWINNPYMTADGKMLGLQIKTSNKIAIDKVLIGQSSTIKERHTGLILRFGAYGDQFIHNEKSVVGEVFSILYQATNHKPSWVYADFDTVIEAISKVA